MITDQQTNRQADKQTGRQTDRKRVIQPLKVDSPQEGWALRLSQVAPLCLSLSPFPTTVNNLTPQWISQGLQFSWVQRGILKSEELYPRTQYNDAVSSQTLTSQLSVLHVSQNWPHISHKVSYKFTWSSAMFGGVWVICSFRYLMALPMLTDRGRHCVKKLKRNKI